MVWTSVGGYTDLRLQSKGLKFSFWWFRLQSKGIKFSILLPPLHNGRAKISILVPPLHNGRAKFFILVPPLHNGRAKISILVPPLHNGRAKFSILMPPLHNGRAMILSEYSERIKYLHCFLDLLIWDNIAKSHSFIINFTLSVNGISIRRNSMLSWVSTAILIFFLRYQSMQNTHYIFRLIGITAILLGVFFTSCRKDTFYENKDAQLSFSEKIITFDTIFTTIGTVTQRFTVFNPHKNTIKTDIALIGGNASFFSVNVDGISGNSFKGIEIPAKDSIFIFVKVNLNPNNQNNPILVADTLAFYTNGNRQNVELVACGEDAHFIVPNATAFDGQLPYRIVAEEGQSVTWTKDKPYVIYGYAAVDANAKLTIEAGTQIYLHKGGGLWISPEGCLRVNGTKDEPVVFQGDQRAFANKNDYAQWDKIWINEGRTDNIINYAIIKNAFIGIQAETLEGKMGNKLILTNSIIQSSEGFGFLGRAYNVEAYNNVFSDCKTSCVVLHGGVYNFTNNTIYKPTSWSKQDTTAVIFANYYDVKNVRFIDDLKANFINNIIYGVRSNEFGSGRIEDADFTLNMENCLIRMPDSQLNKLSSHSDLIINENPLVKNVSSYDFSLNDNSPCKGNGKPTSITVDIIGAARNNPPSIGAYE